MSTWSLLGWGSRHWPAITEAVAGLTCAWADYDGFHVGPCPAQAPPYSHLWAWLDDGTVILRVRLDGVFGVVGGLMRTPFVTPALGGPVFQEDVAVVVERLVLWPPDYERTGKQPASVLELALDQYRVEGPSPISFIGPHR